jgi:hypothetical protein
MEERIEWTTFETYRPPRNKDWYWTVGTLTIVCAIAAGVAQNWLLAIIIVLAGFIVALSAQKPPRQIECTLTKHGILINKDLYPYEHIKSFWIAEEKHANSLLFQLDALLFSRLSIPLGNEIVPDAVRSYLGRFIHEVPHEKRFSDAISDYLGF